MSTTTASDTFARFVEVLANSLDDHETSGEALASCLHLSRFHFDRLVSAAAGEPPTALRRRILLERAAYRLLVSDQDVLSVALEAGYSSHEAFTRAFARAYGSSPSRWRRRPTRFQLEAPSEVHFNPPGGLRVPADGKVTAMELLTRMVEHHLWLVGEMLTRGESLSDEVLDASVEISVEGIDSEPTLRSLLSRLVGQLAMWDAATHDQPYDFSVEEGESVASMRARLAESGTAFLTQVRADRRRGPTRRDVRRCDLRSTGSVHLRGDDRPRPHVRGPPPDTRLRCARRRRRHGPRGRRPHALGSRARLMPDGIANCARLEATRSSIRQVSSLCSSRHGTSTLSGTEVPCRLPVTPARGRSARTCQPSPCRS
jgi:AraC family transcriptional regulator